MPFVLRELHGAEHAVGAHILCVVEKCRSAVVAVVYAVVLVDVIVVAVVEVVVDGEYACRECAVARSGELSDAVARRAPPVVVVDVVVERHVRVVLQHGVVSRLEVERHRSLDVDVLHRLVERLHDVELVPVLCVAVGVDSKRSYVERTVVEVHAVGEAAGCKRRHDGLALHGEQTAAVLQYAVGDVLNARRYGELGEGATIRECIRTYLGKCLGQGDAAEGAASAECVFADSRNRLGHNYLAKRRAVLQRDWVSL